MEPRGVLVVEDPSVPTGRGCTGQVGAFEHVANRPIVHHVLDALERAGVRDIVVASSGELAAEVRECLEARDGRDTATLTYVAGEGAPLDLAGALTLAAPIVRDAPCIVHLAGGLLAGALGPFLEHVRGDAPDVILIMHQAEGSEVDLRASPAMQQLLHVAELDPQRASLGMAGVWMFGPGAIAHAAEAWRGGNMLDAPILAERIAAAGGSFRPLLVDAWRRYSGNPLDLLELNRIALDRLEPEPRSLNGHAEGNRIEGRVWISDQATVRASVIVGPTVIGPGACIADAYIGPYTSIGPGARVEGAEIERSIVASGASIMHIGGRVVASVVGREARIFRDFSLPRALRLRVGDGTEVAFY
jgi:glucose-1-phosphate thymidylyltransferase